MQPSKCTPIARPSSLTNVLQGVTIGWFDTLAEAEEYLEKAQEEAFNEDMEDEHA